MVGCAWLGGNDGGGRRSGDAGVWFNCIGVVMFWKCGEERKGNRGRERE